MPFINTATKGVPKLLTMQCDDNHKDIAEKAIALYIRDRGLTPKTFADSDFKIRWLLPYLCEVDSMWKAIPPE